MDLTALLTHASDTLQGSIGGAELSGGTVLKESQRSRTIRGVLAAAGRGARPVILKQFKANSGDAVLSAVTRLASGAAPHGHLEPVAQFAADLEALLRRQWPEYGTQAPIPVWGS